MSAMQVHGSCAARGGAGVLLVGPPGSGKSDLVLRLRVHGFGLVADDRVDILDGIARPPAALAGLLEVRGLGILRLDHIPHARLHLLVRLGAPGDRLPAPEHDAALNVPVLRLDAAHPGAPDRIALALACALGEVASPAGAFASP
jgi:HPr kinase/phosphorylase